MKRSIITLFFFTSVLLYSCYRPSSKQAFEDLKILEGTWHSYEGPNFSESWTIVSDSLITGIGFSLNETDTAFKEHILIKRIADSIFYGVMTEDNNEFVLFKLVNANSKKWKFINPEHDYPNIIEYELTGTDQLIATVSNFRGNKKIEFKLKKVPK